MARQYTDGEKAAIVRVRRQLRDEHHQDGRLLPGLPRIVAPLLPALVEFLNSDDDEDSDIRADIRNTISAIKAGTYTGGSFPVSILVDYRLERIRGGRYEVRTEACGGTVYELMWFTVYEAMRSGDIDRLTLCALCNTAKIMSRPAKYCTPACRKAASPGTPNRIRQARYRKKIFG